MKLFLTLILAVFISNSLFAQQSKKASGVSEKVYISVTRQQTAPPYLEIKNYQFTDNNSNNKIDANEKVVISFDLHNAGAGPGMGLLLKVEEINHVEGLEFEKPRNIPELKPGESVRIEVPIKGKMNLANGSASFNLIIHEPKGFGPDPLPVEIETQAFKPPELKMVDYQVSSQMGGNLEKRKPFDVEILIQNLGQGMAEDVSSSVSLPENIFCLSSNQFQNIGNLKAGEQRLVTYSFVANNNYKKHTIDFKIRLSEKMGLSAEDTIVSLTMNQKVSVDKLVIKGNKEEKVDIQVASLSSDVDKDIPVSLKKNPNKVALIFGNEDYSGTLDAEVNVEYARRDAAIFWEYASKTLGIAEENIFLYTDATSGTMKTQIERVSELVKRIGEASELVFYYAGHGFPDEKNQTPYLIPVDVNASNLNSAIALKEVYEKFGETGAKKITVILDACFSGGGRNQGLLAARGVRIKPKKEDLLGNMVVFSASTEDQSALPYHEQKHGLFTYFLLRKLKESNGTVTFGQLDNYLKEKVGITSIRVNGKVQDPLTTASPKAMESWKDMTF